MMRVIVLGVLVGCGGGHHEEEPRPYVPRPVKMVTVDLDAPKATFHLPGRFAAPVSTELAFVVAGRITSFPVAEGQQVKAGTIIATIEPRSYEAELAAMSARVDADAAEFERQRERYQQQAGSKAEMDAAQTALAVARAEMRTTSKALDDATLRAPFDGVVARKLVADFANVNPGDPVVLFESTNGLDMLASVSERDLALVIAAGLDDPAVRTTAEVTIETSAADVAPMPGRLKEFSVAIDRTTGAYEARFEVQPAPGVILLPGMTAEALLSVGALAGQVALPTGAILTDDQGDYVWTIDEHGAAHRTGVTRGDVLPGDETLVTGGLTQGQQVAISGVRELAEGYTVKPMPQY